MTYLFMSSTYSYSSWNRGGELKSYSLRGKRKYICNKQKRIGFDWCLKNIMQYRGRHLEKGFALKKLYYGNKIQK